MSLGSPPMAIFRMIICGCSGCPSICRGQSWLQLVHWMQADFARLSMRLTFSWLTLA